MDFAIIKTGGKQYRVSPGDVLKIEKMKGDFKEGDSLTFEEVLFSSKSGDVKIGSPFIDKAAVKAVFVEAGRAKKINVIKYLQKSRYFKKNGHRQPYFKVRIESI
jgi:large subunit ribosomal protein L21